MHEKEEHSDLLMIIAMVIGAKSRGDSFNKLRPCEMIGMHPHKLDTKEILLDKLLLGGVDDPASIIELLKKLESEHLDHLVGARNRYHKDAPASVP